MNLIRLVVVGYLVLTVIYVAVSIYSRSVRREKLEKHWDREHLHEGGEPADRAAHVAKGLEAYRHGLRRKLIWLVYIVPTFAVIGILIWVNAN